MQYGGRKTETRLKKDGKFYVKGYLVSKSHYTTIPLIPQWFLASTISMQPLQSIPYFVRIAYPHVRGKLPQTAHIAHQVFPIAYNMTQEKFSNPIRASCASKLPGIRLCLQCPLCFLCKLATVSLWENCSKLPFGRFSLVYDPRKF